MIRDVLTLPPLCNQSVHSTVARLCYLLQSIMATCACGDEPGHKFQTFGQLIQEVLAGAESQGGALVSRNACQRLHCMFMQLGRRMPVSGTLAAGPVSNSCCLFCKSASSGAAMMYPLQKLDIPPASECCCAQARIPKGFNAALFGKVRDRPLCSLFAWRNATDFAGTCDELPSTCLVKKWCAGRYHGFPLTRCTFENSGTNL